MSFRSALQGGLLVWLLAASSSVQAQGSATGSLTVQLDRAGPVINRNVFGQFAEQLGYGIYEGVWVGKNSKIPNVRGIRSDVVKALKALKIPNVRWPGGCFADQYHWRNGIGPVEKRPVTYNINWGDPVEPNSFGTHEYMDFIDQIGSEANITSNVGSGTVQEAADWLEYLTTDRPTTLAKERTANGHSAPFRVKFFAYGNESYGCGGPMTAEAYTERLKIFSTFARNLNPAQSGNSRFMPGPDPMVRIAVGPADNETDYTEAVMKAWKESSARNRIFDALSFHHYTAGELGSMRDHAVGFTEKDYVAFIKNSYEMDGLIQKQSAIMDKYDPKKEVALSIDEWGVWLQPMPGTPPLYLKQQTSLRDAIVAAIHLNIFARHADRVRMANIAQMVNVLQGMILTDKEKMLLTPTYHVFRMYIPFQDATSLPVELGAGNYQFGLISVPRIDAIAARGKDGKVWLALTNIDPHAALDIEVGLPGISPKGATGETLTAPKIDSVNSFDALDTVVPVPLNAAALTGKLKLHLPPKSITVVQVQE
ncbi:MAG TPA: alpha-L-arabinofuranosidase C-terminal domain-containing protein [Sphingobium sp.]|uniref:alpha-N-arabinofuranosidase n=1 Tax=Sphingobium sp. TaxID=1912891 RepID=UPI002ED5DC86